MGYQGLRYSTAGLVVEPGVTLTVSGTTLVSNISFTQDVIVVYGNLEVDDAAITGGANIIVENGGVANFNRGSRIESSNSVWDFDVMPGGEDRSHTASTEDTFDLVRAQSLDVWFGLAGLRIGGIVRASDWSGAGRIERPIGVRTGGRVWRNGCQVLRFNAVRSSQNGTGSEPG